MAQNDEPVIEGNQVTLEDVERQIAADAVAVKPDYAAMKLEIEGLPDNLKGKSVLEVLDHTKRVEEALRISEKAREEAANGPRTVYVEREQQQQVPQGPQKLTREQVKEMYDNDPLAAFEYMQTQSAAMINQNVEARTAQLRNGIAVSAETQAKQKYAEDFQLFGKEITDIVSRLPDKSALALPGAWDDIVTYVRGQNVDKLIEYRTNKKETEGREAAQRTQAASAPQGSLASQRAPASVAVHGELDPIRKEIAQKLGLTDEEYTKWSQA